MKTTIYFSFLLFVLLGSFNLTHADLNTPELYFYNYSGTRTVTFKIYPISCVFNFEKNYDLKARYPENNQPPFYTYNFINGRNSSTNTFTYVPPNTGGNGLSHDAHPPSNGNLGTLGYGKYKIEVTWSGNPGGFDTCTIEYDNGYSESLPGTNFVADCSIAFKDNNNDPRIVFKWSSSTERNIRDVGKKIEAWNQYENGVRSKELGNFKYDATYNNNFTILPQQSFVTLKIFDILGKEVKTLVNEKKVSGNYEIEFNGRNLASGVYFYRLFATGEAGEFKDIKRMILIK